MSGQKKSLPNKGLQGVGDTRHYTLFADMEVTKSSDKRTFDDLVAMAGSPVNVPKKSAPCFIATDCDVKTDVGITAHNLFSGAIGDVDNHVTLAQLRGVLEAAGIPDALVYASKSATEDNQRWRIVVPYSQQCDAERHEAIAKYLLEVIGGDACAAKANQVAYVPNRGDFYEHCVIRSDADYLDPLDDEAPFVAAAVEAARRRLEAEQAKEAQAKAQRAQRVAERAAKIAASGVIVTGQRSPIDEFNQLYEVTDILAANHYGKRHGGRKWLAPNSKSGMAGVVILGDGELCFSHHSHASDPLADGNAHDAFDVFAILEHGSNFEAALKDAGERTGVTKHNQDQFRKAKHDQHKLREAAEKLAVCRTLAGSHLQQEPAPSTESGEAPLINADTVVGLLCDALTRDQIKAAVELAKVLDITDDDLPLIVGKLQEAHLRVTGAKLGKPDARKMLKRERPAPRPASEVAGVTWDDLASGRYAWPELISQGTDANGNERFLAPKSAKNLLFAMKLDGVTGFIDAMAGETLRIHGAGRDHDANLALADVAARCNVSGIRGGVEAADLAAVANAHWPKEHALVNWIESREWDGKDRLAELVACLTFTDDLYSKAAAQFIRAWMVDGVLGWQADGMVMDRVLTLAGGQGLGKTEFFRRLVSDIEGACLTGKQLITGNVDSIMQTTAAPLVELGEVDATFRKSDIAALKAFLSNSFDEYRRPYARAAVRVPRRTLFCASVNDHEFLSDDENRRFLVLSLKAIDHERFNAIDKQQLWAQVLDIATKQGRQQIDRDLQRSINAQHDNATTDPAVQRVLGCFDFSEPATVWMTSAEMIELAGLGVERQSVLARSIVKVLKHRGIEDKRSGGIRRYKMPAGRRYSHSAL